MSAILDVSSCKVSATAVVLVSERTSMILNSPSIALFSGLLCKGAVILRRLEGPGCELQPICSCILLALPVVNCCPQSLHGYLKLQLL